MLAWFLVCICLLINNYLEVYIYLLGKKEEEKNTRQYKPLLQTLFHLDIVLKWGIYGVTFTRSYW